MKLVAPRALRVLGVVFAVACAASAAPWVAGCGGGASSQPKGTVFSPEQETLFTNGVDFVADPDAFDGPWQAAWGEALRLRTAQADFVVTMRVATFRTDTNPRGERTYRLVGKPSKVHRGAWDGGELTVTSSEGDGGFEGVKASEGRILNQTFVIFGKWRVAAEGDAPTLRWHASLAHPALLGRVAELTK